MAALRRPSLSTTMAKTRNVREVWPMRGFCASLSMLLLPFGLGGNLNAARAQTYPNRNITLVVPFPPGGSTSIVGRVVADKMSQLLGQSIVVDNRGGAGGTIGTRSVA